MANETLAQVPSDVSDPVVLKRFLSSLVERLDVVLGYRGDSAYASDITVKDLATETAENFSSLTETTATLRSDLDSAKEDIADHEERLTSAEDQVGQLQAYKSTDLRDFNVEGWPIFSSFTCLGSEALNPPTSLIAGDTYSFFVTVLPSYTQTVVILNNAGASSMYVRSGLTWSEVAAHGWLSL